MGTFWRCFFLKLQYTPESIYCNIEYEAFFPSNDFASPSPSPSPVSRQQVISHSQSSCVSPVELTDGGVGGSGRGRSQIIRRRENLVLYDTFNTLCHKYTLCLRPGYYMFQTETTETTLALWWEIEAEPATELKKQYCKALHDGHVHDQSLEIFKCATWIELVTEPSLKGHGNEPNFPRFLHKSLWPRSLTLHFEPFRFWLRIRGDIRIWKTTPRVGESGSRQDCLEYPFFSNL